MKAILDTSVVIATDLQPLEGALAVSAITMAELHFGVLVAKTQPVRAERLRRLLKLQQDFDPIPVDQAVAASYGQLAAAVVDAHGRPRARARGRRNAPTAPPPTPPPDPPPAHDLQGLESLIDITPV